MLNTVGAVRRKVTLFKLTQPLCTVMKRKLVEEIIAFLLMVMFLYASVSKWLDFKTFRGDINNQPFPNWITPWLIYTLPPLQVLIAIAVMFDRTRKAGFYASLILMSAYTVYSAAVLMHVFDYIPCSCGGVIKSLSWNQHLILNVFFVAISAVGIWLRKNGSNNESSNLPVLS